ncbi:flavohemoglobin expression-modulating QEGLA motif protein [Marilutibacter alkalisoli]|nr:tyrosine/phenylalanine carboxypeptidase domain-containing protein [Lysobacter alkalisoli]
MSLSAARHIGSDVCGLPPVAAGIDGELAELDRQLDWLLALSPVDNDGLWESFRSSGYTRVEPLRYIDLEIDLDDARQRLLDLPIDRIESPLLEGLLSEKQRELERQVELVRLRGTDGFVTASLDLFGGVDATLLELACDILREVPHGRALVADAGIDEVLEAVEAELDWYRQRAPDFHADIVVDTDIGSMMMVSHGTFYVDGDIRLPHARIQPLVQHEIGTHVVTRYNGSKQPLRQLEVGLAHYDALQEGLGVLAEYLAGYLSGDRLRVLAARVVAVDMAIHGDGIAQIFACLHETHGLPTDDAFDIAVRALRGGGLTKDAVYLSGLCDLIAHLHAGNPLVPLLMGKFALSHRVVLDQLVEHGWAVPPALLPRYFDHPEFEARLAHCRETGIIDFYHLEPRS